MILSESFKSNIWKFYLAGFLAQFAFYTPIIQLFYLGQGLSIFEIAILGVVWSFTRMILEIPSSVLADRWSRKKTMILSYLFSILSLSTLIYSSEYGFFILASIFSAAAYAFLSGTDIAFFYDTLKALKREVEFDKLWARQELLQQIPFTIAFLLSGFLYQISPVLPFQLSLFFLIAALLMTITLNEPPFQRPIKEENIFPHLKQSLLFVLERPQLKSLLLFSLIFSLGSDFSYSYGQIYLNNVSLPIILFGLVYTVKAFFANLSSNLVHYLRKTFSFSNLFGLQLLGITALFYIMLITENYIIAAICFILIAIPHGIFGITKSTYLHQRIKSHQRATIDSMFSSLTSLMFIIIEPGMGFLADRFSIKLPFLLIAIVLTIYFPFFFFSEKKSLQNEKG